MAGALYQALAKNMFLEPVANVIGNYLQRKREKEAMQKYIENIQNMQTGIKDIYADKTANPNRGVQTTTGNLTAQLVGPQTDIAQGNISDDKTAIYPQPDASLWGKQTLPQDQTTPVEVQKPKNFTDLRGTTPLTLAEKNKMANERLINFLMNQMTDKDVPAETKQYGSSLLQQLIQSQQPTKPETMKLREGEEIKTYNTKTGQWETVGSNPKDVTKQNKPPAFKVTEDGYYAYWDENKKDFIPTKTKAPKNKGDQSSAWAKLFYDMQKDKEKESEEEKKAQSRYNDIMGSEWVTMDDLLRQGLITEEDPASKNMGGAYVVRDDKGQARLIFSDEQLKDYAKSQVSEAPNKWERKKDDNDPLGIR